MTDQHIVDDATFENLRNYLYVSPQFFVRGRWEFRHMTDTLIAGLYTGSVALFVGILTLAGGGVVAAAVAGRLTRRLKISEFRQKWIEDLRADIADYIGAAHLWIRIWEDYSHLPHDQKRAFESEKVRPLQNDALVILNRIRMRINPLPDSPTKAEDERLLQSLLDLLDPGKINPTSFEAFWMKMADDVTLQARLLLKREWEVTKDPRFKRDSLDRSVCGI